MKPAFLGLPSDLSAIRAFRVEQFCALHGIGKTKFYEEVKAGRLEILKSGRRTIISRENADKWLQRLNTALK